MQQFITSLKAYFSSQYLITVYFFLGGYVLVYGLAFILSNSGGADQTYLYRCRRGWGVAVLIHLLLLIGFTINWYSEFGYFLTFWHFFPWFIGLLIIDIYLAGAALVGVGRVANYHQS